jgi:hypothetical protein
MKMEIIIKFEIKFNCKVSDKRDIVDSKVSDSSKNYGLEGLKSF